MVKKKKKNHPPLWETRVQSQDWEDTLEKRTAAHSNFLSWRIPCTEQPGGLQSIGSQRVRHDWETNTHDLDFSRQVETPRRISSVQFNSVTQSCPTLGNFMNRSTPGLPVHHHLPEFTQIHVHRVGDAIQPSHPLSSPFPPQQNAEKPVPC